ncbi:MAG: hydantoinase B/oxoprolinase family protein, partial [Pirellulaceae bacterium]|nr:hydantoinase B/oxoprolinase family protein [Pirellulaceae bacterium]
RIEVVGRSDAKIEATHSCAACRTPEPEFIRTVYFDAVPQETSVYQRSTLLPGDRIVGPAIVLESVATTVIDPTWCAEILSGGEILLSQLERDAPPSERVNETHVADVDFAQPADPILLEIFNNHFAGIAQQMGITLRNTSSSVNVKERLDFSCALFTSAGDLVVNAPHIPVHLGAMSETVKQVLAANPEMQAGDVFVTNDPFHGGSHLPDITVITPVHDQATGQLRFITASRAHHAELGGITPGSMPPFSTNLAEEGVLIRNFKVLDAGTSQLDDLRRLLLAGAHPTRAVDDNLADISAQIAANRQGANDLQKLVDRYSWSIARAYMTYMQSAAEQKMRLALRRLPDG